MEIGNQKASLPDYVDLVELREGESRIDWDIGEVAPRYSAEYVAAGLPQAALTHEVEDEDGNSIMVCDGYWREVFRRSFINDMKRALGEPHPDNPQAITLEGIGGLRLRMFGSKVWALRNLPIGELGTAEDGANRFPVHYRKLLAHRRAEAKGKG